MKTMEDVKTWIRRKMEQQVELAKGYESADMRNAAQVCRGRVDVLSDLHTQIAIYFPKAAETGGGQ